MRARGCRDTDNADFQRQGVLLLCRFGASVACCLPLLPLLELLLRVLLLLLLRRQLPACARSVAWVCRQSNVAR